MRGGRTHTRTDAHQHTRAARAHALGVRYELKDPENPLELAFQQKYGQIVEHLWFEEGYIMLGFSKGHDVSFNMHPG